MCHKVGDSQAKHASTVPDGKGLWQESETGYRWSELQKINTDKPQARMHEAYINFPGWGTETLGFDSIFYKCDRLYLSKRAPANQTTIFRLATDV